MATTIVTTDQGHDELYTQLDQSEARIRIYRTDFTAHSNPEFRVEIGTRQLVFQLGRDSKWRWVHVIEWGRTFFINGKACDATGFVITDPDLLHAINNLTDWRTT
ncbi:MAG: hypothetical protein GY906_10210 [bacterium]|nr:hypothetical protein [bacterium]